MENRKINFHYIFWYLIIFSIIGMVIENIFCYVTEGIIESRKGLILGPFCPIYGLGAAFLIGVLDRYKDSDLKIFVLGGIVGSIVEFVISYALEAMYGARFWDYSNNTLNLNGRICLTYTIYWSILSIILMKYIRPKIDMLIDKLPKKKEKIIDIVLVIYITFDVIITIWGVNVYQDRVADAYYGRETKREDNIIKKMEDIVFSNNNMKKLFPNLRTRDKNGNLVFVKDLIKE